MSARGSGFATLSNVLASLAAPSQIPPLMLISERGTLGDFQLGQAIVRRAMRPRDARSATISAADA